MKGDPTVIKHLNVLLKNELTAINQYLLHARMLDDWGLTKLGKHELQESVEEREHADQLVQRILFLEGVPELQNIGQLHIGHDIESLIRGDLKLELDGVADLRAAIAAAEQAGDYISKELFIDILRDEEGHVDHLETMLANIQLQGMQNFVQSHTGEAGEA